MIDAKLNMFHPDLPPVCTAERPSRRAPARRHPLRGRVAAIALAAAAGLLQLALLPGTASALQLTQHALSASFTVDSSEAGGRIAVDEATGDVYVLAKTGNGLKVEKFDATGNPAQFSALGSSTLNVEENILTGGGGGLVGIAVDNSGTATQGRIYVTHLNRESLFAFEPSGAPVGGNFPIRHIKATAVSVDPASAELLIGIQKSESQIARYTPAGAPIGKQFNTSSENNRLPEAIAVDSEGSVYVQSNSGENTFSKFAVSGSLEYELFPAATGLAADPKTNYLYAVNTGNVRQYSSSGMEVAHFGSGLSGAEGVAANGTNGNVYAVRSLSGNGVQVEIFAPGVTVTLPDTTTEPGSDFEPNSVTLNGTVNPDGVETTECRFAWSTDRSFNSSTPCDQGNVLSGSSDQQVTATLTGLTQGQTYHFRLVTANANGTVVGRDLTAIPSAEPTVGAEWTTAVHSDDATVNAEINPGGAPTSFKVEYGPADCAISSCASSGSASAGSGLASAARSLLLAGLEPGATYHYRILATNQSGTVYGVDRTFTTFVAGSGIDPCANAHVRQQTGAALLLDCRAYELVSAAYTGGYPVESSLVPGQTPYGGFPEAEDPPRVLYAVHDGAIPGAGRPTNKGPDPYVATRGEGGWSTEYVGVPADDPFAEKPFSSIPSAADAGLRTFAFGAAGSCSPCFEGGYTGIPVHLSDGSLVQGMTGPEFVEPEAAKPDGHIAAPLSADGTHLVFGSTALFAPGGNSGTDVSIYDHNLATGETNVVSNAPSTEDFPVPLPCLQGAGHCNAAHSDSNGISELAISADGSHILVAQKVRTDAAGNVYWHLYMEVNDAVSSIDLTPATTTGVLFDGMTADGSKVFFTTTDKLLPAEDTDSSADVYESEVGEGSAQLKLISTGPTGPSNSESCNPVAGGVHAHWNSLAATPNCDALAVGGGASVAPGAGGIYFLSPERLAGNANGTENAPNLYLAAEGSPSRFIATLSPNDPSVLDALAEAETRHTADFQVTANGSYAAFNSVLPLTGYENAGFSEVYRYDLPDSRLDCVSCNPSNARPSGGSTLAANGLSLTSAGQVFFNSNDALSPRDLDNTEDVYEWEPQGVGDCGPESPNLNTAPGTCLGLVSTGASPFSSSLLSADASGTDAYFFTRDTLVPQDKNGSLVKIYDARAGGGFPYQAPPPPCAASDECHGPGSAPPGPPSINTLNGNLGNLLAATGCPPGLVKRRGQCARKPHHKKGHHRQHRSHRKRTGRHG